MPPSYGRGLSVTLDGTMEMWRTDLPSSFNSADNAALFLAYWHCRLLVYLLMPSVLTKDVMWAAKESAELLRTNTHLTSPLHHYFTTLTALALTELAKVDESRDEATRVIISEYLETNVPSNSWELAVREMLKDRLRPTTSSGIEGTASQSLQHLADLAAAKSATTISTDEAKKRPAVDGSLRTADDYEDLGFNPRPMLRAGYMNAVPTTY